MLCANDSAQQVCLAPVNAPVNVCPCAGMAMVADAGLAGSAGVYTLSMSQLLPVLEQPHDAALMLRLLHEEGIVGREHLHCFLPDNCHSAKPLPNSSVLTIPGSGLTHGRCLAPHTASGLRTCVVTRIKYTDKQYMQAPGWAD